MASNSFHEKKKKKKRSEGSEYRLIASEAYFVVTATNSDVDFESHQKLYCVIGHLCWTLSYNGKSRMEGKIDHVPTKSSRQRVNYFLQYKPSPGKFGL